MSGLWMNDEATPEGKYPIVLRRDGTPLAKPYFVMVLHDPAVAAGLRGYADAAEAMSYDPKYVADVRALASQAEVLAADPNSGADPDAPRHRTDDPIVLAWARSLGKPSA
jgi:hypothetical protein